MLIPIPGREWTGVNGGNGGGQAAAVLSKRIDQANASDARGRTHVFGVKRCDCCRLACPQQHAVPMRQAELAGQFECMVDHLGRGHRQRKQPPNRGDIPQESIPRDDIPVLPGTQLAHQFAQNLPQQDRWRRVRSQLPQKLASLGLLQWISAI